MPYVLRLGSIIAPTKLPGSLEPIVRLPTGARTPLSLMLRWAALFLAALCVLTMLFHGDSLSWGLQATLAALHQHAGFYAPALLALLLFAASLMPSKSLLWRCVALCAAGFAVMVTLAHGADRLFAASPLALPQGVSDPADRMLSQLAISLTVVLLAIGEGMLLCRQRHGRVVLVIAAAWSCVPIIGFATGLAGMQSAAALLLGTSGILIAVAGLLSGIDTHPPGALAAADHTQRAAPPDPGFDLLTGLLNRHTFDRHIAAHPRGQTGAMMLVDIDRFRSANHVLGNKAADQILIEIARRLEDLAASHAVARTGGDEFAIYCEAIPGDAAQALAERLVTAMARPFVMQDGRQFYLTASVGLAHSATEGVSDLRDAADEAVFIAKNQGGNQAVSFLRSLHEARIERISLEQDLYSAFRNSDELFLVYQPIISLRDQSIVAIEALARWQHPTAGLVPPSRFVGIAEAAGLFSGLGAKIRELAVKQVADWRDSGIANLPVVNLNVSPLELMRADVPGTLSALVDHYGLERSGFCLEVTEGTFADEAASQALQSARDAGFLVAMDDFGVGYSSLSQLPKLPLTSVKLDRSFLTLARDSAEGISLFATIVQLAHVLKLPVVAEGVETPAELAVASDCGCDSVQGYFFARPLSPAQLELCLRRSMQNGGPLRIAFPLASPDPN